MLYPSTGPKHRDQHHFVIIIRIDTVTKMRSTSTLGAPLALITIIIVGLPRTVFSYAPESSSSFQQARRSAFASFANSTITQALSTTSALPTTSTSAANSTAVDASQTSDASSMWPYWWLLVSFVTLSLLLGVCIGASCEEKSQRRKSNTQRRIEDVELQALPANFAEPKFPTVPSVAHMAAPKVDTMPDTVAPAKVPTKEFDIKRQQWASDVATLRGSETDYGGKQGKLYDSFGSHHQMDGASSSRVAAAEGADRPSNAIVTINVGGERFVVIRDAEDGGRIVHAGSMV